MTSLDVAALAAELQAVLAGARVEKAYQPEKDMILVRLRQKGTGRLDLLFGVGRFLTLTKRPPENPDKPSMVAQILRNTLGNARVTGVGQVAFDRILRMDLERGDGRYALVFEVFGDGNMLLLDGAGQILLPLRGGDYGARRLRKGEGYQPPPSGAQPLEMDLPALEAAGQRAGKDLVRMLAVELGFGPLWAEELCLRAGLERKQSPQEMDASQWARLHEAISRLADEIRRNDLAPALVYDEGTPFDAVPFTLQKYPSPRFAHEEATSFHEALDAFFVGGEERDDEDPRRARYEEARGKLQRQVAQIEGATGRFEEEEAEARCRGDALYASFQQVQAILDQLNKARADRPWSEVAATIQQARDAGNTAVQDILQIRPDTAQATIRVQDAEGAAVEVTVDLRRSVQDNADAQYEAAKKARSRREGAGAALEDARTRLAQLEAKGLDAFGAAPQRKAAPSRHFWFETYRWTITPGGLLAVGGRSAAQNDAVVKKYLRDGDRYVHASIHGAPSVVVRHPETVVEPSPDDLRVACQFAACSSRAWRQFGEAAAYWVSPQQVSKTPRSGEFVPRGAWIVHGRRTTIDGLPMAWAIGRVAFQRNGVPMPLEDGHLATAPIVKLVGGPPDGLAPFAVDVLSIAPGDIEPNEASTRIAAHFDVDVEEAQAVLPPGPVRLPGLGLAKEESA